MSGARPTAQGPGNWPSGIRALRLILAALRLEPCGRGSGDERIEGDALSAIATASRCPGAGFERRRARGDRRVAGCRVARARDRGVRARAVGPGAGRRGPPAVRRHRRRGVRARRCPGTPAAPQRSSGAGPADHRSDPRRAAPDGGHVPAGGAVRGSGRPDRDAHRRVVVVDRRRGGDRGRSRRRGQRRAGVRRAARAHASAASRRSRVGAHRPRPPRRRADCAGSTSGVGERVSV